MFWLHSNRSCTPAFTFRVDVSIYIPSPQHQNQRYCFTITNGGGVSNNTRDVESTLSALRRENAALKYRLERKEKRIDELLEEKFGFENLLQRKSSEVLQLRKDLQRMRDQQAEESKELAKTPRKLELERRRPSGFTVSSVAGEAKALPTLPGLSEWARRPSDIRPVLLRDEGWVVSQVPEEERTE